MPDKAPTLRIRPEIDALEDSRIVQVWKLGFEVPDVIGRLIDIYVERRHPDERFVDTVRRLGLEPFKERVYAAR